MFALMFSNSKEAQDARAKLSTAESSAPSAGKEKPGALQAAASAKALEQLQATEQRLGEVERELAAAKGAIVATEQRLQVELSSLEFSLPGLVPFTPPIKCFAINKIIALIDL